MGLYIRSSGGVGGYFIVVRLNISREHLLTKGIAQKLKGRDEEHILFPVFLVKVKDAASIKKPSAVG